MRLSQPWSRGEGSPLPRGGPEDHWRGSPGKERVPLAGRARAVVEEHAGLRSGSHLRQVLFILSNAKKPFSLIVLFFCSQ